MSNILFYYEVEKDGESQYYAHRTPSWAEITYSTDITGLFLGMPVTRAWIHTPELVATCTVNGVTPRYNEKEFLMVKLRAVEA